MAEIYCYVMPQAYFVSLSLSLSLSLSHTHTHAYIYLYIEIDRLIDNGTYTIYYGTYTNKKIAKIHYCVCL